MSEITINSEFPGSVLNQIQKTTIYDNNEKYIFCNNTFIKVSDCKNITFDDIKKDHIKIRYVYMRLTDDELIELFNYDIEILCNNYPFIKNRITTNIILNINLTKEKNKIFKNIYFELDILKDLLFNHSDKYNLITNIGLNNNTNFILKEYIPKYFDSIDKVNDKIIKRLYSYNDDIMIESIINITDNNILQKLLNEMLNYREAKYSYKSFIEKITKYDKLISLLYDEHKESLIRHVNNNPNIIKYINEQDKTYDICLKIYLQDKTLLQYCSNEFKNKYKNKLMEEITNKLEEIKLFI